MANMIGSGSYKGELLNDSNPQTMGLMKPEQTIVIKGEDKEIIRQALVVITNAINAYVKDGNMRGYLTMFISLLTSLLLK